MSGESEDPCRTPRWTEKEPEMKLFTMTDDISVYKSSIHLMNFL